jgi:tripartite-type tricarboxylate transporter receptor subunit TctC
MRKIGVKRYAFVLLASAILADIGIVKFAMAVGDSPWPTRPIHFIVAFRAGSTSDTIARILAQKLGERLGQQVLVENRVGASGELGSEAVAHAQPDGYTIGLAATSTHAAAVTLTPHLPYDPIKDFTFISMLGTTPFILAVYPGLKAKSVQDLIHLAKIEPHRLSFATAGPASMAFLAGALFENMARVHLNEVPYQGTGQSVMDLIKGRIDITFATIPPTLALIQTGQVRALAITGAKRIAALPEVPTIAEAALPGYEAVLWQALVMPAGVPKGVVDRMNKEANDILDDPSVRKQFLTQGVIPEGSTQQALMARVRADITKWHDIIERSGISLN